MRGLMRLMIRATHQCRAPYWCCSHDETGSQALYLGRREWAYIPGLSLEKSEALLNEIWSVAVRPEFVWQQKWLPGDLIVWDTVASCIEGMTSIHSHGLDEYGARLLARTSTIAPKRLRHRVIAISTHVTTCTLSNR